MQLRSSVRSVFCAVLILLLLTSCTPQNKTPPEAPSPTLNEDTPSDSQPILPTDPTPDQAPATSPIAKPVLWSEPKTEGLTVLTIGNSFSGDGYAYLYDIFAANGITDVTLCYLYIGGGSLLDHAESIVSDSASYRFHIFDRNGHSITEGHQFSEIISLFPWDLIVLQQASSDSGLSETYSPGCKMVLDAAKEGCTNPNVKFAWHMTWAYQTDSTHAAFENYGHDQATMYQGIVNAIEANILPSAEFDFFIPVGTAIQNARTSSLGDTLTKDGHHLSPFGRYLASYTWYASLTGKLPTELVFSPQDQSLNDTDFAILIACLKNAINSPLSVTEIDF